MDEWQLDYWRSELADAYWPYLFGDYDYADWKLLDLTKRYFNDVEQEHKEYEQAKETKGRSRRARASFKRRNSNTD